MLSPRCWTTWRPYAGHRRAPGGFPSAGGAGASQQTREADLARQVSEEERFARYKVNVLVDNSETKGAPVIFEYSPTTTACLGAWIFVHASAPLAPT